MNYCNICGYRGDITHCPVCHNTNPIITPLDEEELDVILDISYDESFVKAMEELKKKDIIEYNQKLSQFKIQHEQKKIAQKQHQSESSKTHCPKCNSTNIQAVTRKWSLLTGFMTNKVDRICINCKHKF